MHTDTEPSVELHSQNSMMSSRVVELFAIALFALALAITATRAIKNADAQFVGAHAFVSADVATTARTFASQGVWKLRGVPVNNNPPIGPNDQYTHWPPLLPILLSNCFRLFGATERAAHIFMLCTQIITALLLFRLGWVWLGPVTGALSGYFWLTLPVVVQFGDLVAQQSLAMLFVVAAALAFASERDRVGAVMLFIAVLSAWEAVLVLPGIWVASLRVPNLRRAAISATVGIGSGVFCVVVLYISSSPAILADTMQTARYYMGLSPEYSRLLSHDRIGLKFTQQVAGIVWNHLWMLGILGTSAIVEMVAVRSKNASLLLATLGAPWIFWTVLMRTHVAIHHFELLIAAPLAALALARLATAQLRVRFSRKAVMIASLLVVLSAIQLIVLPHPKLLPSTESVDDYSPERLIRYSRGIRENTEPNAIVIAPLESAIPIYYSERHIVRGIAGTGDLESELPRVRRDFPNCPIYLAIPPFLSGNFVSTLSKSTAVASGADVIVARL